MAVHPQPVFIDRTPPQVGSVRDGSIPQRDAQYQSSSNEVCVNYNGFVDQDSGISSFLWTVMSDGVELLSRELSVAEMTLQTACEAVSRPHNSRYYSTITAFNGGSNEMNATGTSDGGRLQWTCTHIAMCMYVCTVQYTWDVWLQRRTVIGKRRTFCMYVHCCGGKQVLFTHKPTHHTQNAVAFCM